MGGRTGGGRSNCRGDRGGWEGGEGVTGRGSEGREGPRVGTGPEEYRKMVFVYRYTGTIKCSCMNHSYIDLLFFAFLKANNQ